jgi:signal recognition particle GTPase
MGKIRETWDDRNKKSQQEKFAKSMEKMANAEKWTLNDFNEELKETLGGWRSKLPGVSGLSQTKMAKQTQEIVESIMSQVGPGATAEDLQNLSRHEKVRVRESRDEFQVYSL